MPSMKKMLPTLIQQQKTIILIGFYGVNVKGATSINPTM